MPSPGPWISPRQTGFVGTPSTKQETMSVPPEIEARWTSGLIASYTKSKFSGASGEPVEVSMRTLERSCVSRGRRPAFFTASMNFADVPNTVISSAAA